MHIKIDQQIQRALFIGVGTFFVGWSIAKIIFAYQTQVFSDVVWQICAVILWSLAIWQTMNRLREENEKREANNG